MQVLAVVREVDDRVADELAGAVVGDVAAAFDLEYLDGPVGRQKVLGVAAPAA